MSYLSGLFFILLLSGVVGVVVNPAPLYGVLSLVLCAGAGCGVLVSFGGSFVGLVLFLVYLGGMLVVFAYSIALASEQKMAHWADYSVLGYIMGYGLALLVMGHVIEVQSVFAFGDCSFVGPIFQLDVLGVVLLFSSGGCLLLLCGWGLTLTLFVVLELTRGFVSGCLRVLKF